MYMGNIYRNISFVTIKNKFWSIDICNSQKYEISLKMLVLSVKDVRYHKDIASKQYMKQTTTWGQKSFAIIDKELNGNAQNMFCW